MKSISNAQTKNLFFFILLFLMMPVLFGDDLLGENTFDNGTVWPWHIAEDTGGKGDFEWRDGKMAAKVINPGENAWSVQIRHRGLTIEQGHTYNVKLRVMATASVEAYIKIGLMDTPYTEYWNNNWKAVDLPANQWVELDQTFTMSNATANTCEFTFHLGGPRAKGNSNYEVILDEVFLEDPQYIKPPADDDPALDVRVNQIGYFPKGVKKASAVIASTSPVEWKLLDASNKAVSSGLTTVFGLDHDSQDNIHIIDFTSFTQPGIGYKLILPKINTKTNFSHNFDIRDDLYAKLKYDALAYFYHNRSGIDIVMPYAGRTDLTRAAGHVDVAPNKGDSSVATWPNSGQANYSKDVKGGWYDAGDHGKYVVNGGISVWTMLNQYERTQYINGADLTPFQDGKMLIPENNNGLPDLLDEAKWEIDFLLKMQVTESEDPGLSGMVHHKIHDETWTAIPTAPAADPKDRYLRPVSTAATLNLAAITAQAYRIWKNLDTNETGADDKFARQCLTAAEKAWTAAVAHPALYAPLHETGGGPYNDDYVLDDFYWAAAELYAATGKKVYEDYIKASPHYLQMSHKLQSSLDSGLVGAFTWGTTQGMGTLTLSMIPNGLGSTAIQSARQNIQNASDQWLAMIEEQGYRLPFKPAESDGQYPWGSNSFLLNIMLVMAYAYDYTNEIKYFNGITESMDYILGRNALDLSYVTGYGQRAYQNPHHRFWAYQVSKDYPKPPAGCVSGGPNSRFQDPSVKAKIPKGTPIQKVYFDHIESWSTNEVTINWNAPFAWVTGYLDEKSSPVSVTLTSPQNAAVIPSGNDVELKAEVRSSQASVVKVEFYAGTLLLGSDKTAPYTYQWVKPANGQYSLTAKAYLSEGDPVLSPAVFIEVKKSTPPTLSLKAPLNGAVYAHGDPVLIKADAADQDGTVAKVEFFVDNNLIGSDTSAPYEISWSAAGAGSHTIKALAIDNDGLTSNPDQVSIEVTAAQAEITLKYEYNAWSNGLTANITVTNNSNSDINDWVLTFDFDNGEKITSSWSSDFSQTGSSVELSTTLGWNKTIKKGESRLIAGFQATHGGTTTRPKAFYLNGIKLQIID